MCHLFCSPVVDTSHLCWRWHPLRSPKKTPLHLWRGWWNTCGPISGASFLCCCSCFSLLVVSDTTPSFKSSACCCWFLCSVQMQLQSFGVISCSSCCVCNEPFPKQSYEDVSVLQVKVEHCEAWKDHTWHILTVLFSLKLYYVINFWPQVRWLFLITLVVWLTGS